MNFCKDCKYYNRSFQSCSHEKVIKTDYITGEVFSQFCIYVRSTKEHCDKFELKPPPTTECVKKDTGRFVWIKNLLG